MVKISISLLMVILISACGHKKSPDNGYKSDTLVIKPLTENTFVHISYLKVPGMGVFPCNGLLYKSGNKVMVFDTPTNDAASGELIRWIQNELDCKVEAVIVNHFHVDCLGGLGAFHHAGIPSYAGNSTIDLVRDKGGELPLHPLDLEHAMDFDGNRVIHKWLGEGHTSDNIVSFLPGEGVLFGGCLVKELNAGYGNLHDANTGEWPETITRVKAAFPGVKWVVPGHGEAGGTELLDYTRELFSTMDGSNAR